MKEYCTFTFSKTPDWDVVPVEKLSNFLWEGENPYRPETTVQICGVESQGIFVRIRSKELPYRAVCTQRDDSVCTDSCVEFFFYPFDPEVDARYLNFEINPHCVCRSEIGKERANRAFVSSMTDARCGISPLHVEGGWGIELFVPQRLIAICYGISFETEMCKSILANVYKCADMAERPHYESLFNIDTPQPDFHRPEFFGKIIFSDERTSSI